MKKRILLLVGLLLFVCGTVYATTIKDDMVFEGAIEFKGAVEFEGTVTNTDALYRSAVSPVATKNVGITVDGTEGDLYLIACDQNVETYGCGDGQGPSDNAGVTVTLATPTAALNGWEPTFVKVGTGATDFFLWAGGAKFDSGTTDNKTLDAAFDWITVQCYYESATEYGYIIKGYGNK